MKLKVLIPCPLALTVFDEGDDDFGTSVDDFGLVVELVLYEKKKKLKIVQNNHKHTVMMMVTNVLLKKKTIF